MSLSNRYGYVLIPVVCFFWISCPYPPACFYRAGPCVVGPASNDEIQWEQIIDERGGQTVRAIEMTSGGNVLLGGILDRSVNPHAWLARVGPGGVAWSEPLKQGYLYVEQLCYLPDDTFLMATSDLELRRMDLDGNTVWVTDAGLEEPLSVYLNSSGFATIAKNSEGKVVLSFYSPDGALSWQVPYNDGIIMMLGFSEDGTFVSYNYVDGRTFNLKWENEGNTKITGPYKIENYGDWTPIKAQILPDGGVAIIFKNHLEGSDDIKIICIGNSGLLRWDKNIPDNWHVSSLAGMSDGTVLLAGGSCESGERGRDAWVSAIDHQGNVIWERWFGGGDRESAQAIAADERGCVAVAAARCGTECGEWIFVFSTNGAVCIP